MKSLYQILLLGLTVSTVFGGPLLEKANTFYTTGDYAQAISTYHRALEKGENPALTHFNLANSYYQVDSIAKAIVHYQAVIREAPAFFRAYLNLGILYYNLDNMAAAAHILEKANQREPDNAQLMVILAATYKNLHEYSLAVPLLERIIEQENISSKHYTDDCYFLLYEINREIGDIDEARHWIERYPDEGKRAADKYQLLGELAMETGNNSEAIFCYSHLVKIAPELKWPHYQLVKLLSSEGNVLSSLQHAHDVLTVHSDFKELALLAGNIAFEQKYYYKAEMFYHKACLLAHPGGLVGLRNLIHRYSSQGQRNDVDRLNHLLLQK